MARPKGSRTVLVRITYDDIGRLAGIAGDTAKQYAQRGQFDSRDLDSLLKWVNARRSAKGLSLIGLPTDEAVSDDDSEAVTWETPLCPPTRLSRGLALARCDGADGRPGRTAAEPRPRKFPEAAPRVRVVPAPHFLNTLHPTRRLEVGRVNG